MAHVRTQIRNAVKLKLSGLPTTGAHVYVNRLYPLQQSDLPALIVRTDDEQVESASLAIPSTLVRNLAVHVECIASANSALADTLDQIVAEVEVALAQDAAAFTLDGLAQSVLLRGITIELDAQADMPVGRATLALDVQYLTLSTAPEAAL